MSYNKKGLGRGLGALISSAEQNIENSTDLKNGILYVDINKIEPNKGQPRKYFDDEALSELASSLKEYGIISPLIVKEEDGFYKIIAGERRWRAARIAKIDSVPVIVKDYSESEILEIALIENIQRQDLNPIEEALCFKRLAEEFFFSHEDIAEKIGKSRNKISYSIRLLNLDERVQNFIIEGKLSAGHGNAILACKGFDDQFLLCEKIFDEGASVREAENIIKKFYEEKATKSKQVHETTFKSLESDLTHILGTKVNIKDGRKKGKIEIEYYSKDELERLLYLFKGIN